RRRGVGEVSPSGRSGCPPTRPVRTLLRITSLPNPRCECSTGDDDVARRSVVDCAYGQPPADPLPPGRRSYADPLDPTTGGRSSALRGGEVARADPAHPG